MACRIGVFPVFGILIVVTLLRRPLPPHEPPLAFMLTIAALVVLSFCAYFRSRIHFRSYGVYIYRWGRPAGVQPYASFVRAELGYWSALRLARPDGTYWNIPSMQDPETLRQVLWRLRRAGLPVPDDIALRNRFGETSAGNGELRTFRKAQRHR